METWGFCDACGRWFYYATRTNGDEPPRCPVCRTEPSRLEERAVNPSATRGEA